AVEASRVPVIASHSGLRHFTPGFERNLSDELAKAIAAKGGVIQVTFGSAFVNPQMAADLVANMQAEAALEARNAAARAAGKPEEDEAAFAAEWKRAHPPLATSISAVLDQIDYGVKLVGIDHIGLGSDFDGVSGNLPDGLRAGLDRRPYPQQVAAEDLADVAVAVAARLQAGD
ncbi:membrane dipeptidase, partial [Caulobacter sp.]|uniref:membrane dipeptidase n=1 Tax=Caulobacter sp. TaxID=78 RepID=UPI001B0208EB